VPGLAPEVGLQRPRSRRTCSFAQASLGVTRKGGSPSFSAQD
jgi:hypothetical protein